MLQEPIRQHQRADGQVLEAARHADVHNEGGVVQVDEQLGGHGGVDLAHAAAAGDDVLADTVERYPAFSWSSGVSSVSILSISPFMAYSSPMRMLVSS